MAIEINPVITGQQAGDVLTYCYLYEPLKIRVIESDLTARKLYVNIKRYDIETKTEVDSFIKYAEFDLNPGKPIVFDLMEITQQLHKAELYKYSDISDFKVLKNQSVVSKYYYSYHVWSEVTTDKPAILKLPIVGGRDFRQFVPSVSSNSPLTEFDYYGIDKTLIQNRWGASNFLLFKLADINGANYLPLIDNQTGAETFPEGGMIYYKSRFGGWMFWGFDIQRKTFSQNYEGSLNVGMFESTDDAGGKPFIPVDYTGVTSSYNLELKALSLTAIELLAVSGIASAPIVYYADNINGKFELMRVSSFSAPISNIANGGDFTVSLKAISTTSHKVK